MTIIIFADDVVEVRVMELANTEATEAAAPLHPREMQEDADLQSKRSNNKQTVKCDICDKGFTSVSSRNKHLKSHFEGQYTCKHCGKVFTEIGNRNRHERNVHTTQQFDCITCGKQFKLLKSLKAHIQKKHSAEKDSDSGGAAEAPVGAAVPSTLESQQEVEDLDKTIDAVESDMEEVEVCLTDHLDVLNNSAWVSNEVTLSSGGAEDREELAPPETRDMEDQTEANTAVTTEDFATIYRSCFSDTINNNLSMTTVNIGEKVVTITGDTMDLVMEARRRIEEAEPIEPVEAGAV